VANRIAAVADFFSFGTNDLTPDRARLRVTMSRVAGLDYVSCSPYRVPIARVAAARAAAA
jgi:phosphoenolpyruvate synthase/pyruvate phosphate dikinase